MFQAGSGQHAILSRDFVTAAATTNHPQFDRRDGRVVEGARLESVYRGNSIEGSNPSLSAITNPYISGPEVCACNERGVLLSIRPRGWPTPSLNNDKQCNPCLKIQT